MNEENESIVEEGTGETRNFRRVLEDRAKEAEARAEAAESELTTFKKNEAFREAGINPNDPRQSYFVKGYEGEVSTEAIRNAALEAGFIDGNNVQPFDQSTTPRSMEPVETVTYREELMAQQRVANASVEGLPVAQPDLRERLTSAKSAEELKALWQSNGGSVNVQD